MDVGDSQALIIWAKNQGDFALNTDFLEWLMYSIEDVNIEDAGNIHSIIM